MKKQLAYILSAMTLLSMAYSCTGDILEITDEKTEIPDESGTPDEGNIPDSTPADTLALLPTFNKVSAFPTIKITTDDGASISSKTEYVSGSIVFSDPDGMYSDSATVSSTMRIRGRGNTTWGYTKKPYRIKLDVKHKVFGMKGDKDWVLLAEYTDASLLRNQVAMQISRICGLPWTPDSRSAEVWLNGSYIGVYTLMEQPEIGRSKVNITPVEGSELDGGYFMEIDDKSDDDAYIRSSVFHKKTKFKHPQAPTLAQKAHFKSALDNLEALLNKGDFENAMPLINTDSFVSYYLAEEIIRNIDGNMRLSTKYSWENGIFTLQMIWDNDLTLGNCTYFNSEYYYSNGYKDWFIRDCGGYPYTGTSYDNGQRSYFQCLFENPDFVKAVQDKWAEILPDLNTVPDYIDALVDYYGEAMGREYNAWYFRSGSYSSAVSSLKSFYKNRISWMDSNIPSIGVLN